MARLKEHYQRGGLADGTVKTRLIDMLEKFLAVAAVSVDLPAISIKVANADAPAKCRWLLAAKRTER